MVIDIDELRDRLREEQGILDTWVNQLVARNERLVEENARLRTVLREIARFNPDWHPEVAADHCMKLARDALVVP